MNNAQMLAAVLALPNADLTTPSKIDDPIGAGTYYRADTVARLLATERKRLIGIARGIARSQAEEGNDGYGVGAQIVAALRKA